MRNFILSGIVAFTLAGCSGKNSKVTNVTDEASNSMEKILDGHLPTVGILIFEGFLTNEVVAPMDVFKAKNSEEKHLFNVVIIAKENKIYESEEGLKVLPDFTIDQTPDLNVLVVPSSYHPENQIKDTALVNFLKEQNETTDYIASHCSGAFLLGASGVADNKKIVTYVTGGTSLKEHYPNLKVMDDSKVSVAEDGKIISSNGSLVSYIASLDLLERMTSPAHRKHVEEYLLLDRLTGEE